MMKDTERVRSRARAEVVKRFDGNDRET